MRDLQMYANECMRELDNLDIAYGNPVRFEINTRAKKRWGRCRKTADGYLISINIDLLDERNDVEGLKNTIIHELLHSCKGCMNHRMEWKVLAEKVNRAYGYNIKRTSSAEEKGCDHHRQPNRATEDYKYAVRCSGCGQVIRRKRMSKVIAHPDRYRCGCCGGKLRRMFIV